MNHNDHSMIPEHMMKNMKKYIEKKEPIGGFLTSVFANDLFKAVSKADDKNIDLIKNYVLWIWNNAPMECYGSYEKVKNWTNNK